MLLNYESRSAKLRECASVKKFGEAHLWHIRADDNENPACYNINASGENPKSIILRLLRRALSSVLRRGCENA